MDFEKVKTWIEQNKLLAAGIGILAVGAIAYLLTPSRSGNNQRPGLSGIPQRRTQRRKKLYSGDIKLIGLE